MARRAKPHDEELPFVALMDTMTNVVGVLIIVLVMIGIGLAKSVQKVLSELPMVSVEEHDKLKAAMAEFDAKRDPAEVAAEIAKRQAELDKIAEALKKLEAEKAASPVVMVDLEKLVQELDKLRKERDQRKTAAEAVLAEIDKLKKKLDTTPRYEPPPGVIVRLPAPRPMPEKAELQRVFVSAGKVSFARNEELSDIVEEQLRKEDPAFFLKKEILKGPDGKPLTKKGPTGQNIVQRKIYVNGNKMSDFFNTAFNKRKAGPRDPNRDVFVEVVQIPNSPTVQMRLTPKPDGGESVEQAAGQNSFFRNQLRAFKQNPKAVVWFHVSKDSIPTYLAIRDVVDREQVPVGWEITDKPVFSQNMPGDYLVDFIPAPAPPAAAAAANKPAGPPPVTIAAPKAAVD